MYWFLIIMALLLSTTSVAQVEWPRTIGSTTGDSIRLYQPQPESFKGDLLKVRTAVSVIPKGSANPVFGCIWIHATMQNNRATRMVMLHKVKVTDVRFPAPPDSTAVTRLKALLETEIPKWNIAISLDQLLASLEEQNGTMGKDLLNTAPPTILYKDKPSMLVLIDGEPKLTNNKELGVDLVMNTAFIIVKDKKEKYYLYGGGQWYRSEAIAGPWAIASSLPKQIKTVNKKIKEKQDPASVRSDSAAKVPLTIVISTEPAELIQSNGAADYAPVNGTNLLYMTNTDDDIFMHINDQQYYVLLSGRWYKAAALNGPWTYVPADGLPADFAKIPEGSAKGNVLATVAGTPAAHDAVLDAQVPQTAKVDRKKATTTVKYDGEPVFKQVEGADLQYAVNTSATVLLYNATYYCVDNGVWFESAHAEGPWKVAVSRPAEVEKIPPSNPAYNTKYVYIYDATPEYVYMGYTPGYTGAYVYGPTVVYGTGMYYNPWYGPHYYPRPATYGFSMHYNPWSGWSVGFHFSTGWFNMHIYGGGYHGGYWGPPMYRPPYYHPPHYRGPVYVNHRTNNVYVNHRGVTTTDRARPMPANRPAGVNNQLPSNRARPNNDLVTDRQGNVFQKNEKGWQQREGNNWQQVNNNRPEVSNLDQQQQMRDRGNTRSNEFNQYNRNVNRPSTSHRPAPVRRR